MSTKSKRHRQNQKKESHLLDHDPIEQRALQIARSEGRHSISQDDRLRAQEELDSPNALPTDPEFTPGMEPQLVAWDEAPASTGKQTPKVQPEDEKNIVQDLIENGLRMPSRSRIAPSNL